jgi:hypothetical protein
VEILANPNSEYNEFGEREIISTLEFLYVLSDLVEKDDTAPTSPTDWYYHVPLPDPVVDSYKYETINKRGGKIRTESGDVATILGAVPHPFGGEFVRVQFDDGSTEDIWIKEIRIGGDSIR